ncbi:MAG: hypothetical protein IPG01_16760 [Chitinophagaceae bacterium]|nr:hypothetical protein [Chitinophagaceae bacterium]
MVSLAGTTLRKPGIVGGGFDGVGGLPTFNKDNWPQYGNDVSLAKNSGGAIGDSSWLEDGRYSAGKSHVTNDPFAP